MKQRRHLFFDFIRYPGSLSVGFIRELGAIFFVLSKGYCLFHYPSFPGQKKFYSKYIL